MTPVQLEIIMPLITTLGFGCRSCSLIFNQAGIEDGYRNDCANDYPEEWRESLEQLLEWISEIKRLYKHRLRVQLIDAQSPTGLWKQVRHRLSQMPAFIVDRKLVHMGWNRDQLEALIDRRIRETSGA
ncbi:MAG: hypothetical protein HY912_02040 [Desulfomonile tiedjei]|uniref:Uncharacterized protein n=1 Tax=Desulfomonile tiedjei TaxID=2358 RepID=A0A9D6Z4I6_9BACT|nr:hypothetical protein [Desulfomonile tiedjei]